VLEAEIAAMPCSLRHLGSDLARLGFGWLDRRLDLEPRLIRLRNRQPDAASHGAAVAGD
jgi:hypothetical protein